MLGIKKNKGITLIALIITIIVLLILAGVVLTLVIGEDGIINMAKKAGENYIDAEEQERKDLEDLYSSMMVATNDDAKITISMEDLRTLIKNEVKEQYSQQLEGIKFDTYISNIKTDVTVYNEVTSMTGFTRVTDSNNNISEYLSYSTTDGYTVLKSGWYYIKLLSRVISSDTATDVRLGFYVNNQKASEVYSWSSGIGYGDRNENTFSIYLSEGDKIHFTAIASGSSAKTREGVGYCYPMF